MLIFLYAVDIDIWQVLLKFFTAASATSERRERLHGDVRSLVKDQNLYLESESEKFHMKRSY